MTEKRFNKVEVYLSYEIFDNKANEQLDVNKTVDLMNQLNDKNIELHIQNDFLKDENQHMRDLVNENEQLKQQLTDCKEKKQQMKEFFMNSEPVIEQKKLQKVIYQTVINLIDEKIKEYKKYDGYDTEKYYIGTGTLKELKRELKNND